MIAELKNNRQAIEAARAVFDTINAQIEALKNKRGDYSARAETAKAEITAAEEARKTALKLFASDEGDEKAVSAAVAKIIELELTARTLNEIIASIGSAIADLDEEKKAASKTLGKETAAAWIAIFGYELEKARPVLNKLYSLHFYARRAQRGPMAVSNEDTFKDVLRDVGTFKPDRQAITDLKRSPRQRSRGKSPAKSQDLLN